MIALSDYLVVSAVLFTVGIAGIILNPRSVYLTAREKR